MSDLMDKKLKPVEKCMTTITKDVEEIKDRMDSMEGLISKNTKDIEILKEQTKKIDPLVEKTNRIELLLENDVLPRLQNIEACYTSTYQRYAAEADRIDGLQADMDLVKKVVTEHSVKLQRLA